MGKVMERVRLSNIGEHLDALAGKIPADAVHTVDVDGLVDTGATCLVIPADLVERLGLRSEGTRQVRYADGRRAPVPLVGGIRLEILGRWMTCDALVHPVGTPVLIGQIPLEGLDLVVDPKNRELRPNPESPDAPLMDVMSAA